MSIHFNMLSIISLIFLTIPISDASHFRGGTINWKPTNTINEVEFRFKLGWTYGNGAGCTELLIGQYVTSGWEASGKWICTSGCSTQIALSNTSYICTGASRSENWEQGEYSFKHQFPDKGPFTIGFSGGAWMSLDYGSSGSWNVETVVDLRTRNDTQRINSSPISGSRPIYRLQYGCQNTLTLPMTDSDGDIVKCRWSSGTECASVCNGLPSAILDEDTCTLHFHATTTNQYIANGWYAVALTIEDYPRSQISIGGITVMPTTPISSAPIQFLINTPSLSGSCDEIPVFVNNTPYENQLIVVKARQSLNIRFYAESKFSITDITLMSPGGLQKSALLSDDLGRADVSYIRVTWTPRQTDKGAHLLCGTAEDSQGKMSAPRCMTILAWDDDPCESIPCQNNGTCNRIGFTQDFNCICSPGYTGILCETRINHCKDSPCLHGGTCVNHLKNYSCICDESWYGYICEYSNATSETINEYSDCKCVIGPMKSKAAKNRDVLCGFIGMLISLTLVILTYYFRMRHLNNKVTVKRNLSASTLYPDVADIQYKRNLYIDR